MIKLLFPISFIFIQSFELRAENSITIEKVIVLTNRNSFQSQSSDTIIPRNNEIALKHGQNSILILFKSKHRSSFAYSLKYFNYDTLVTSENQILYTNLPSGDYEFTVTDRLDPFRVSASLKLSIEPPIWQRWWFLPSVFAYAILLVSILLYFFFQYRLRQQLHLQRVRHELEIKALRAQMNPHFIFNSMNTIDAYILRKRFVEASDCLQKFSKLIRKILENSENQTVSVSQELETLQLYIELEQERFSHSFQYQFDIDPALIEKDYQIPPLLIQPFVENAILHGIRNLPDGNGMILVKLVKSVNNVDKKASDVLLCRIEDNGIGRAAASAMNLLNNRTHRSMGMHITLERISTYQAIYGEKMETLIADLERGTRVEIKLPLISI